MGGGSQKRKREKGCSQRDIIRRLKSVAIGPPKHKELEHYFSKTSLILPCIQRILIVCLALCCLFTSENPEPAMQAGGGAVYSDCAVLSSLPASGRSPEKL